MPGQRFAGALHGVTVEGEVVGSPREFQRRAGGSGGGQYMQACNLRVRGDDEFPVRVGVVASSASPAGAAIREIAPGTTVQVTGRLSTYDGDWTLRAEEVAVVDEGRAPRVSVNGHTGELVPAYAR